jgi:hypothetical protein
VPDHLLYFKKKNIEYLFKKNSFQIINCKTINNENDIQVIVKKITNKKNIKIKKNKINRLNLLKKFTKVENLIKNLKSIVKEYKNNNKKIAVWGAGHRTLALLSLSNLHEIEYVVDSADFKQGKYTPILHKKIVHPDFLRTNKVDLLIIMVPGIYPDEVAKYVVNMKLGINIIKLNNEGRYKFFFKDKGYQFNDEKINNLVNQFYVNYGNVLEEFNVRPDLLN